MPLTLKFVPPLIFLAIGFALTLVAEGYERELHRLQQLAEKTTATVTAKRVETSAGADKTKGAERKHLVTYRFTPKEGSEIERTVVVDPAYFDSLKEGDVLPVTYRADEPSLHALDHASILVSGTQQYAPNAGGLSKLLAAALAALAVAWVLFAPRFLRLS